MVMSMVGAGAGGGTAGMDEGVGSTGVFAIGVGAGIAVRQSVVLNLDKREEELRQSESVKQGYMVVERSTPYRLRLSTAHQAVFTNGSARLMPQILVVLHDIAKTMKLHADAKIVITGHADDGRTDKPLAGHRARAASRYLEHHGVEAWRIERSTADHAIDPANGKKEASTHRHLDIILTSQLLGLRADLDLQEHHISQLQSSQDGDLIVKRAAPDTLKLTMAHQAAFAPGSNELPPKGSAILDNLAVLLKRHPYASVEIIGHANDGNSPDKNSQLSEQRAETVANHLKQGGMDASRIHSKGIGKIVYNMEGKHAQDAYRRVEIFISNRLLNLAKYVDQQEDEAFLLQSAIHENLIIRRPTVSKLDLMLAHQAAFATSSAEDRKLSGLRARVVADFLKQQGIAPERVDSKGVGRILYAPVNKDETDTFQRVEIMVEARHGI